MDIRKFVRYFKYKIEDGNGEIRLTYDREVYFFSFVKFLFFFLRLEFLRILNKGRVISFGICRCIFGIVDRCEMGILE